MVAGGNTKGGWLRVAAYTVQTAEMKFSRFGSDRPWSKGYEDIRTELEKFSVKNNKTEDRKSVDSAHFQNGSLESIKSSCRL